MAHSALEVIARDLKRTVGRMRFGPPVSHVYNPLEYAWRSHAAYLRRYGRGAGRILLLGMNPGPFGMAQTGVPFGEVESVRDWLGIEAKVDRPMHAHPRRPIEGFACARREVSGRRLWGWAQARFGEPERFFERFFVVNYCPLCFMEASGRNVTPDKLAARTRATLFAVCDRALRSTVEHLRPRIVVGIGGFAARRAEIALADLTVPIDRVLHPSPASPAANRGWESVMDKALAAWSRDGHVCG